MTRMVAWTPRQRQQAQEQAAASAASQLEAVTHALHDEEDPNGFFAACVCLYGKPNELLTPEQEACLRSRLHPDDGSPLFFAAVEAHYGIKASGLPARQSLPGTGGRDYTTIMQEIRVVRKQVWENGLKCMEEAESECRMRLDELCREAIMVFPEGSNIVFGSAMKGAAFYVNPGGPDALKHAGHITAAALPRLGVVNLMTPVEFVASGARGKGANDVQTRSGGSAAGGRMIGDVPSCPMLPELPVLRHANGERSFTIYGPEAISTMLACKQVLRQIAQERDAALEERGQEPEHVEALKISMEQVHACAQLYHEVANAGKGWKQFFRLILPAEGEILLDDGALGAFYDQRVDSLVFKLMPPGSDVSSGISYVAVHAGTELAPPPISIPCMDKHLNDDKFPQMVDRLNINICLFVPPGYIAEGELGGTFVQEQADMSSFVNPTLGENLQVLSGLRKSTTMDAVNGMLHASVPVVLEPRMSMPETKIFCRNLFGGDIDDLVLTLGKVVCGKQYSNVETNEHGMLLNKSFQVMLRPVQPHASTGTSPLFKDLVPEEMSDVSQFQKLVVVDSTHNGAQSLHTGVCKSTFTVKRGARAGLVKSPEEHSKCIFGFDEKGNITKFGIVHPGGNDNHLCTHHHLPALCKVLLNPQSAFRLPDGTMKQGPEGLRVALDVSTLGELMYLGIFETRKKAHTITIKKHEGKDDETGEHVDMSQAQTGMCGEFPCLVLPVPSDVHIKTTVKAGPTPIPKFQCVYLADTGEQEPEGNDVELQAGEPYELPFPLQYTPQSYPDGWSMDFAGGSKLRIFTHDESSDFKKSTWGDQCSELLPPSKRRKT